MGREDIDGHACTKFKVSFGKEGTDVGRTWETPAAFVWFAREFGSCPLRMEVINSVGETNATLLFKDIDRKIPEAALFDAPKDFTRWEGRAGFDEAHHGELAEGQMIVRTVDLRRTYRQAVVV